MADGDPADGAQVGLPVLTSPTGTYSFTGLVPGNYVVVQTQPNGYLTVTDGDTTDASDDLANPSTTDNSIPVTVVAGETDSGNDFIEELPAAIGNLVWNDANNNGLRDPGEGPLSGVLVELLTGTGTLISSDTTDLDGLYSFTDLAPGSYQIRIPAAPVGYSLSSTSTEVSDNQVDNDDNGTMTSGVTTSSVIALAPGETDNSVGFRLLSTRHHQRHRVL